MQPPKGKGKGNDADGKGKAAVPGGVRLDDSERIRVLQRYDVLRDKVGQDGKTACMRFIAGMTCPKGNECVYSHDKGKHSFGQADLAIVTQALGVIDRRYAGRRERSQGRGAAAQWQPGGKGTAKTGKQALASLISIAGMRSRIRIGVSTRTAFSGTSILMLQIIRGESDREAGAVRLR